MGNRSLLTAAALALALPAAAAIPTSIQRVNTVGGAAPTTGCGRGNTGAESGVAYPGGLLRLQAPRRVLTPQPTMPRWRSAAMSSLP